jgi:hypothetical protein
MYNYITPVDERLASPMVLEERVYTIDHSKVSLL